MCIMKLFYKFSYFYMKSLQIPYTANKLIIRVIKLIVLFLIVKQISRIK